MKRQEVTSYDKATKYPNRIICRTLPQPARFNNEPITFVVSVDITPANSRVGKVLRPSSSDPSVWCVIGVPYPCLVHGKGTVPSPGLGAEKNAFSLMGVLPPYKISESLVNRLFISPNRGVELYPSMGPPIGQ